MANLYDFLNLLNIPRKSFLLLLLVLSGCSNEIFWNSGGSPTQVKKDSIARLFYINKDEKEEFGTGFFVQAPKGVCALLTTSHLVAASRRAQPVFNSNKSFNLISSVDLQIQTSNGKTWKASNVQLLPELDLAIVAFDPKQENCPHRAVKFGKSDDIETTNEVYIVGYKAGTERPESYIITGAVTSVLNSSISQGYKFAHNAGTLVGMVGGPILNQKGEVIGINGFSETEISKLQNLAIQAIPGENYSSGYQDTKAQQGITQPDSSASEIRWAIPSKEYQENAPEISLTPKPPTAQEWVTWGEILLALGGYPVALTIFDKAIELDPGYALAWRRKAFIKITALNKLEEGLSDIEKAIELDPSSEYSLSVRAVALSKLGRHGEAITSLKKSIEFNANYFEGWVLLGNEYIEMRQYNDAISNLDRALTLNSGSADVWFLKGKALFLLNRLNDSLDPLNKALEINAQSFPSLVFKGMALAGLERWDECLSSLDKSITVKNSSAEVWSLKSSCLNNLRRHREAIDAAEKAINLDANNLMAWQQKAKGLALIRRYTQALEASEKALSIDGKSAYSWSLKGATLALLGRRREAIKCFDKALSIDPKNEDVQKVRDALR